MGQTVFKFPGFDRRTAWRRGVRRAARVGLVGLLAGLSGCVYPTRGAYVARLVDQVVPIPGQALAPPRLRMGSMPFDAWYSPLDLLEPGALAPHRYRQGWWVGPTGGSDRGILYTRRGGFLDIAHTRNAMDLTRFVYEPVLKALRQGRGAVRLMSVEPDVYHLALGDAAALSDAERRALARAIAGRLAYLMTTWHEVATWHGYKGMGVFTERPSAFSYDDAASHMVGVEAAMEALAREPRLKRFNEAATAALARQLSALGVVDAATAGARVRAVADRWYAGSQPVLRVIHMGLTGEKLWGRTLDADPVKTWVWSRDDAVAGRAVDDWYAVEIELRLYEGPAIMAAAGRDPGERYLVPERDFPALRTEMMGAGSPYVAAR